MNCSFCGKSEYEVQVMINKYAGSDVCICDECVKLCQEIILDSERTADMKAAERMAFSELWGTDL